MQLPKTRIRREHIFTGLLVGLLLTGFNYFVQAMLARRGISGADTVWDDIAIGTLGATAAYLWVRVEAERQARAHEKLILVIELNHHVRNALSLITHCASLEDEQEKYRLIDSAIERIDRVLTELVPTAGEAHAPRFFLDSQPQPIQGSAERPDIP